MSRRFLILTVSLFALCSLALPAFAADNDGTLRREIQLNQFTASGQSSPALLMATDGSLLAAWESRRQQVGRYGVYARRLDAWGGFRGDELPVNLNRDSHRRHPVLAARDGITWMVWEAWGQDGEAGGIVARRAGGDEILLNTVRSGSQESPVALAMPGGGLLAAWTTPGSRPGTLRIAGRLLNADGAFDGPELRLSAADEVLDRQPVLAIDSRGGFHLAWQREGAGIFLRDFDLEGAPRGPARRIIGEGIEPALAPLPAGGCALAWLDLVDENWRARLSAFDAEGRTLWTCAPGEAQPGWQSGVALAANDRGELAVAWNQVSIDGEDSDVLARRYGAGGAPAGAAFRVNGVSEGRQSLGIATGAGRLALGADGRLAAVWEGDSRQGDASAANLTLLLPTPTQPLAALWTRGRLALAGFMGMLGRDDAGFAAGAAAPHQPPVFDPTSIQVPDPEPSWAGGGGRDAGWQAIANTGWTPPDPHMAVSANHVMAMTNGGVAAFSKDGTQLWFDDISGSGGFWGSLGIGTFVFDPEVIFDPHAQRFIVMACERTSSQSYFDLGISATADPTGAWHKYRLNVTSLAGDDIDSPNLAVDTEAIYLSADFFGPDKYLIYILDKSSVLDGGTPVATHYLHTGSQSFGFPVQYDNSGALVMIEADESFSGNTVTLRAIQDPLGSPSMVSTTLSVPTYWNPANARSQGTSSTITTFEARFWSSVIRNGSLWACHHISPTSLRNSVAARWYEIELNGWPSGGLPSLRQEGTVLPGNTGFATFNSISVNAMGDAAMVFAYSSPNHYFSMQRVARSAGDPLGSMGEAVLLKESNGAYTGSRWGDYSAVAVDPAGFEFWMIHEYAMSGSWNTWVSHFLNDLTAAPDFAAAETVGSAWPNPSHGLTRLRFTLPGEAMTVRLEIFDVEGRRVRSLDRGGLAAGEHLVNWDGRDDAGRALAAGQYLSRLNVDGRSLPGPKITLVK